jgi:ABC-type amino acid transport substrate-binding protein
VASLFAADGPKHLRHPSQRALKRLSETCSTLYAFEEIPLKRTFDLSPGAKSRRRMLHQMGSVVAAPLLLRTVGVFAQPAVHTLKPGVLSVGTYFVNPPFEFLSHGERTGFEYDLMQQLAQRLNLRAEFAETQWEHILHEMEEQRYDCIIGGITITPARQRTVAFSVPYLTTTLSLIINTSKSPANMTEADLAKATVGVQAATTDYDAAVAMKKAGKIGDVKVYTFARIADAIGDLSAGRIQAVMKVHPVAAWFVQQTPGLRILGPVPSDPQPLGIGFSKASTALVTVVNRTLKRMQEDGTYRTLAQHWNIS